LTLPRRKRLTLVMQLMAKCRAGYPCGSLTAPRRRVARTKQETVLSFRWPIDLGLTVASHGWVYLAPWRWDPDASRLARVERIGSWTGTVAVTQHKPTAVTVHSDGFAAADRSEILSRVRRWLSADWEPTAAVAALPDAAELIERGGGRMLRGSTFYEDFVKTVLTINTSWSATCRMVAALVTEPGSGAFPGPETVLDYGEARLRERAKLGFRARTVVLTTRRMLDDGAITSSGDGAIERLGHDYLLGLKGIGPYAAAHCRILLHDFSRIPVDSVATAYLRERYGCDPAAFAVDRSSWADYLALGYRLARLSEKLGLAVPPNQNNTSGGKSPGSSPNLRTAGVSRTGTSSGQMKRRSR
jgi:3-methyladenine DNA glycosylase/8-oxoguanine DNA glycosylase